MPAVISYVEVVSRNEIFKEIFGYVRCIEKTEILEVHSMNDSSGPQRCGKCCVPSAGIAMKGITCRCGDYLMK